jgi:phage repressor protein C with HTH and peptisase S24 domain
MRDFSQGRLWAAIDALAKWRGLSPSGLARLSGLDPTAFNRSKRQSADGRPRWLSTESLAKVLAATGTSIDEFILLMRGEPMPLEHKAMRAVPLLGRAGAGEGVDPGQTGAEEVLAPAGAEGEVYALAVHGDSMMPLYREGDFLIIDPSASFRPGNRIIARLRSGEVLAKILKRNEAQRVVLQSFNPACPDLVLRAGEIEWMARIIWASQ